MSEFVLKLLGFVVRVGLLLAGLVFFASLLVAGLVLLLLWLLRALWAKITGQPVQPWAFTINRQAAWQRFYPRGGGPQQRASQAETAVDPDTPEAADVNVVTDVEPKRLTPR